MPTLTYAERPRKTQGLARGGRRVDFALGGDFRQALAEDSPRCSHSRQIDERPPNRRALQLVVAAGYVEARKLGATQPQLDLLAVAPVLLDVELPHVAV